MGNETIHMKDIEVQNPKKNLKISNEDSEFLHLQKQIFSPYRKSVTYGSQRKAFAVEVIPTYSKKRKKYGRPYRVVIGGRHEFVVCDPDGKMKPRSFTKGYNSYLFYTMMGVPKHNMVVFVFDYKMYSLNLRTFRKKLVSRECNLVDAEFRDLELVTDDLWAFVERTTLNGCVYDYKKKKWKRLRECKKVRCIHANKDCVFFGGWRKIYVYDSMTLKLRKKIEKIQLLSEKGSTAMIGVFRGYISALDYNRDKDLMVASLFSYGLPSTVLIMKNVLSKSEPMQTVFEYQKCDLLIRIMRYKNYYTMQTWDHSRKELFLCLKMNDKSELEHLSTGRDKALQLMCVGWGDREKKFCVGVNNTCDAFLLVNRRYSKVDEIAVKDLEERMEFLLDADLFGIIEVKTKSVSLRVLRFNVLI